jgi:hypothetical protein
MRDRVLAVVVIATPLLLIPFGSTSAQGTTLSCEGFTKNADGTWSAGANTKPFDVGSTKSTTVRNMTIGPHAVNIGGVDLYDLLEKTCGKKP